MFTGIVEALGVIERIESDGPAKTLLIHAPVISSQAKIGDSIAVNGACLTVVESAVPALRFQAGAETLGRTNLGALRPGDRVNLERSLRLGDPLGDPLGGHLVQGHIDGTGCIQRRQREGEWDKVWIDCPAELAEQMVPKGSVAVDGVSLTLVDVDATNFSVALIPHTLANTTLGFKQVGAAVNLETDILGKYVLKHLRGQQK